MTSTPSAPAVTPSIVPPGAGTQLCAFGDTIQVKLTCKQKTAKDPVEGQPPQGVVAWDVEVTNQDGEAVALYTILTLVKRLA